MRVRDLEIALVLAREMKAAAARSVDASLRLDQLQEVFGVEELDRAERARIQTALQMAGLEPFPSLLEADPAEPIRFGAAKVAAPAAAGTAASAPPGPPPADEPPTFPTVGQFARSKFGRSRRARRGDNDHGAGHAPPPAELPPEEDELEEPVAEVEETVPEAFEQEPVEAPEPELEAAPEPELEAEPDSELEAEAEPEDGREYIPLVPPEEVEPPATGYGTYEPLPEPAPHQPARSDDLFVALLPAVAIPVIVTSIAGWRFGLPFVALSVIATGVFRGRRSSIAVVLTTTAVLTVVSIAASVLLASVGKDNPASTAKKTITPPKAATSTPAAPAPVPKKHHKKRKQATRPAPVAPDPGTQGLVRVPPRSTTTTPTTTTPTATTPTTTTPTP